MKATLIHIQISKNTIISNIQKCLGKDSSWIFDSAKDHTIIISKYNPSDCISYIKSKKRVKQSQKRIMNVSNDVWSDIYIL